MLGQQRNPRKTGPLAGWLLGAVLLGDPATDSRFVVPLAVPAASGRVLEAVVDGRGDTYPAQLLGEGTALALLPRPAPPDAPVRPVWAAQGGAPAAGGVTVEEGPDGVLRIQVDGALFTEYRTEGGRRPCFHPVHFQGVPMTRAWPLGEAEGEAHDHPHHRSLWFSFGDVNGHDLWSQEPGAGEIRLRSVDDLVSGPVFGSFRARHDWCSADGTILCQDERVLRVYATQPERVFDYEVTLIASQGPVEFGDTKEGMMGWRVPATMRLRGEVGRGHIANSEGLRDADTWGARAAWCDYHGPVADAVRGVAILDHPDNLRYPTWWHVRDYGLFAANPFGRHSFEGAPAGAGRHRLEEGRRLTFRYRFVLHAGTEVDGQVARHAAAWALARGP